MAKAMLIVSALVAALSLAPQAVAGKPPPTNPSIAQYVEVVPTSSGAAVPGEGTGTSLSKRVDEQLPDTPEGTALRNIASSAAYGAPQRRLHAGERAAVVARGAMEPKADVSSATFSAAIDAVGAKRSVILWLGLVLFATAAAGVAAAVTRARR